MIGGRNDEENDVRRSHGGVPGVGVARRRAEETMGELRNGHPDGKGLPDRRDVGVDHDEHGCRRNEEADEDTE